MPSSGRLHRATAIIPLAVLSAAWTASLAGAGPGSAGAGSDGAHTLPDGTVLPTAAVEAPASVGDSVTRAAALTPGSASDIPQIALSAYQRAEAVINQADGRCHLPWELIAAIGRVESDHGRVRGNTLDQQGVARPGLFGAALDGTNGTQDVADTDAGQYDGDTRHDRAVGPMQFIPSTWAVVGVDGDSDGARNPQDVDDAALATAVYLCSGEEDLSAEAGQRASVYRYHPSNDYVDLVLEIMQAYLDGDFTPVPTTGANVPDATSPAIGTGGTGGEGVEDGEGGDKGDKGDEGDGGGKDRDDEVSPTHDPTPTTSTDPTPSQPQTTTPSPDQTQTHSPSPTKDPTPTATTSVPTLPSPNPTLPPLPTSTITATLTWAEAQAQCLVTDPLNVADCIAGLLNP